jgi:hypothetical protein
MFAGTPIPAKELKSKIEKGAAPTASFFVFNSYSVFYLINSPKSST